MFFRLVCLLGFGQKIYCSHLQHFSFDEPALLMDVLNGQPEWSGKEHAEKCNIEDQSTCMQLTAFADV